jgi:hypothetical protein
MPVPLTTAPVVVDSARPQQLAGLLGELCLRALALSLAVAGLIAVGAFLIGG